MLEFSQNFTTRLFALESYKKRLVLIVFDGSAASISLLLAFFMRLEATDFLYQIDTFVGVLLATTTALSVFAARGLYNNITRHISSESVYNIAIGSVISCSVLLSGILLFELLIPRSVPLIYAMLLCLFATAVRFFIRALGKNITKEKRQNIAIYGTGPDSVQLVEALQKNTKYRVRLLIGDNPKMNGKTVGGVTIYNLAHAAQKIKQLEIKILLMTESSDIAIMLDRILEELSEYPLKIKKIPNISNLISGKTNLTEMVDIKIEELLGRKPAVHSSELMAKSIAGKTVFVTGAGGTIGSELCRQIIMCKPKKLIMLDISEYAIYALLKEIEQHPSSQVAELIPVIGSVQDRQFVKKIFDRFDIDTTYHAAAYKHVPLMEQNVMQCFANNVFGTLNMVELAITGNVKNFVLVSTDKAVNPTNFMGASKRFSEIICQSIPTNKSKTCFSIVRFGNVLGSSGSVVPLFRKQIESGGPITITHPDIMRYFMTVSEAALLVIQAGAIAKGGDIFVLDMGKPMKILELAERMVALSGLKPILNGSERIRDNEIAITITGLRPGEKLFEELSYAPNLLGTVHPQIHTTAESMMNRDEFQVLLNAAGDAIRENDHQKLHETIHAVTEGVANLEGSVDIFIERDDAGGNKVVSLPN